MHPAAFWLVVLAAGCDGVFKLTELPRPPDAAADSIVDASLCEYATLSPNGDKDMDGVINAMDPCPTVAMEGAHDEDGDSILDACDPCPMTVIAGDDLDCDLLGAACDPDDVVPHVQTFFGLGDTKGLKVGAVVVANDRVTGPTGGTSGSVLTSSQVSPIARYEIVGHIRQIDTVYRSISLDLVDPAAGATYECQLSMDSGFASIDIQRNNVSLAPLMLGDPTTTEVQFQLVVEYDGSVLTLRVSGDYTATTSTTVSLGPVQFGFGTYHDASTPVVEVDYLRRVVRQ